MIKVAVCILNYNGAKVLPTFLPSVIEHSVNSDIYVIDNASTDESLAILNKYPSIKVIVNASNTGYAGGYNQGLKNIDADYYILLNSDMEVTANWIAPVIEQMELDKKVATAQPKIKAYKQKTHFEFAGAAGGRLDSYGYPYCDGRLFNDCEPDNNQYEQINTIAWASGAALFIRANLFHLCNGFDEDFFAHQEEIDLCWRLHHLGYKHLYIPQSTVYHLGGATLTAANPFKTYLNFRNNLFLLIKNDFRWYWFLILLLRLILDGIAGIFFVFKGQFKHCLAIIKAHCSMYFHFFHFYNKRRIIKKNTLNNQLITDSNLIPLPFKNIGKI